MKYLFAGGGSGGHIYPAIAIADEIRKLDSNAEIIFIGAKGRIEEKIVPSNNYRLETIEISGFDRNNYLKNAGLPLRVLNSMRRCFSIIKEFRPDVAIGTGGFVSGPAIYAAVKMKVPALIQEGNSYAGKTVKFLSGRVDRVIINFKETEKYFKRKDNIKVIPHPVRSSLKETDRAEALQKFGLPSDRKTVFIFGGSQGARGINNAAEKIIRKLSNDNLNVIWQTGANDYKRLSSEFLDLKESVIITEFIENMDTAYSASDVIICRAGITSIMELAVLGKAAILVPLPTSAENHQVMNAESLASKNAAIMIRENELEKRLYTELTNLITDEEKLKEYRQSIRKFADREAAKKIAEEAINLIKK